jgi:hypothetical protein
MPAERHRHPNITCGVDHGVDKESVFTQRQVHHHAMSERERRVWRKLCLSVHLGTGLFHPPHTRTPAQTMERSTERIELNVTL